MGDDQKPKRVALVASKGTLDMAYPPLMLATTAASMGWEAGIFFTFYGLDIINKRKCRNLKVAPLGNPAMPVSVPNIIGAIPGMTGIATWMMRRMMRKQNMPSIPELLGISQKLGVRLFGCSTTMGVMTVADEDLLEGTECAGAAGFLEFASGAQVTLFV
ncbi:MAG: DsrE/DsrF/DrsH-like family protein [Dehalococcoidia bacterium]|nr:DsrE/DsrF/DrsH-like family protein [Dehalococcoidia bacterium]MDP7240770.1 DsrE/DsrF/DrsH-like family protein [Dehalococcoidia bacterium]